GAFWVSDAAAGVSTLYTGDVGGTPIATNSLVVTIPPAAGQPQGKPSGEVFNNTSDFVITSGGSSAPATFIFAGLDGTISAWNSGAGTKAVLKATTQGAVYTGLAIGSTGQGNFLYAANVPAGRIDVFDRNFALMTPQSNDFVDPMLPAGFVPFNVQNINSILF